MNTTPTQPLASASLNARERKAQRLLVHYATCERLARYLNPKACYLLSDNAMSPEEKEEQRAIRHQIDGKKISVALFKAERLGNQGATAYCNGEEFRHEGKSYPWHKEWAWEDFSRLVAWEVKQALGTLPPGFFVNSDPRGHALKIDNENPEGQLLIATVGLHRDMGGYGILSPEINGDR